MVEILRRFGARRRSVILVLTVVANAVILSGQQRLAAFNAGFILMCLLPGYLLTRRLLVEYHLVDWLETVALTVGMGFATLILGTLVVHYIPGQLTSAHLLVLYDGLILLLTLLIPSHGRTDAIRADKLRSRRWMLLLPLLLVGAFLRFWNLDYSEFQGDEARAMLMAAGAIRGEDGILFLHRKGPAEILVPMAFYALHGTTNELVSRLPFALANVAGLLSVYILTRRLFSDRWLASIVALGLLAVDGYLVAFGRIVQYQSLVVLMGALTAWCAYVWFTTGRVRLLWFAALFLAVGILSHYEAAFVAPFAVWLLVARARGDAWPLARWVRYSAGPASLFWAVVTLFYGPFVLHPNFNRTLQYLTEGRIGGSFLYNNLGDFFWRASFYSSTYYIVLLILGALAVAFWEAHRAVHPRLVSYIVSAVAVIGLGIAALLPDLLVIGGVDLGFMPFVALLGLVVGSSSASTELKAVFLWFGLTSIFLFFLVNKPKNHGYLLMPAWTVLVGAAVGQAGEVLKGSSLRLQGGRCFGEVILAAGVLLMGVFGYYEYIVFVRHTPSFLHAYPESRPLFYPSVHGDQLPRVGFFGFPHRSGLKAVGALREQGVIQGSYGTNAEPLIASWYTRKMAWCQNSADYYVVGNPIQDAQPLPLKVIREEHDLMARVLSEGETTSEIYSRRPVESPTEYELESLEGPFDATTEVDVWLWALRSPVAGRQVDVQVGDLARIIGYDAPSQVTAGQAFPLMLYWQSLASFDRDYDVFVHIEIEGERIWAQSNGPPGCGSYPTTDWAEDSTIVDGHSLWLDPSTPPGEYLLVAGLYDLVTGKRVSVTGPNASSSGDAVILGTVEVAAPSAAWTSGEDRT